MWKLALSAAIEEIGNVRVLLSFGEPKIVDVVRSKDSGENVARQLRRKGDRQGIRLVVYGKAHKVCMWPIRDREIIEAGNRKRARDLSRAVRTKIEEDD